MVYHGKRRIISAQDMAEKIKTLKQANRRIKKLNQMIKGEERDIRIAELSISKHKKEIRLLEENFKIGTTDKEEN